MKWISVKDRLPEDGTPVLAWNGYSIWMGKRRKKEPKQRGGLWNFHGTFYTDDFVKYWMPLPAAPMEDWSWQCNECGSDEFTSAVSEQDIEDFSCTACGANEFHKVDK